MLSLPLPVSKQRLHTVEAILRFYEQIFGTVPVPPKVHATYMHIYWQQARKNDGSSVFSIGMTFTDTISNPPLSLEADTWASSRIRRPFAVVECPKKKTAS